MDNNFINGEVLEFYEELELSEAKVKLLDVTMESKITKQPVKTFNFGDQLAKFKPTCKAYVKKSIGLF